jgi:hypothetical protein
MSAGESARIERRLSTEPNSWSQPLRFMRHFKADSGDRKKEPSRRIRTAQDVSTFVGTKIGGQKLMISSTNKLRNLRRRLYVGG